MNEPRTKVYPSTIAEGVECADKIAADTYTYEDIQRVGSHLSDALGCFTRLQAMGVPDVLMVDGISDAAGLLDHVLAAVGALDDLCIQLRNEGVTE
jgi:hypothetical protein